MPDPILNTKVIPWPLQSPPTHFRLIEVPITVAQGSLPSVTIPDQPDLRYARILNVETYTATDFAFSQPSGLAVITDAMMPKLSLTLETNDSDITNGKNDTGGAGRFNSTQQNYQYLPFASLHIIQNSANAPFVRNSRPLWNTYVTWQKSMLNIASGGLGNSGVVCGLLGVWYTWVDIFGNPIQRT